MHTGTDRCTAHSLCTPAARCARAISGRAAGPRAAVRGAAVTAEPVSVHAPAAGPPPAAPAALARRGVPALGGRSRRGRRPPPARCPARRARRPDLRRARPVPDGRHRARGRPGRAVGGHVPGDERPAVLGRRDGAARRRLPQPGRRPGRRGRRRPRRVRTAVPLVPDALRRRWRRAALHDPGAMAGTPLRQRRRCPGGRPGARRPAGAVPHGPLGAACRAVRPHLVPAQRSPAVAAAHRRGAGPRRRSGRRGRDGGLARRPPDHVVFSDGVAATFGPPVPATRP